MKIISLNYTIFSSLKITHWKSIINEYMIENFPST